MRGLAVGLWLWAAAARAADPTDVQILERLVAQDALEAQAGLLGLQRAQSRAVFRLAERKAAREEAAEREERRLAGRWGVALVGVEALPVPMQTRQRRKANELEELGRLSGQAFDQQFAERQGREAAEAVDFLQVARANAHAPELQRLLEGRLAEAEQEQRESQHLQRRLSPPQPPPVLGR